MPRITLPELKVPPQQVKLLASEQRVLNLIESFRSSSDEITPAMVSLLFRKVLAHTKAYGTSGSVRAALRELFVLKLGNPDARALFKRKWIAAGVEPLSTDAVTNLVLAMARDGRVDAEEAQRLLDLLRLDGKVSYEEAAAAFNAAFYNSSAYAELNKRLLSVVNRRLGGILRKPIYTAEDVFRAVDLAILDDGLRKNMEHSMNPAQGVDGRSLMDNALWLSDHQMKGVAPDLFRRYFSGVAPASVTELKLAAARLTERNGGEMNLVTVRLLAARTDGDGTRTTEEQAAIDWMAKNLKIAEEAREAFSRYRSGVTTAGDLRSQAATPLGAVNPFAAFTDDDRQLKALGLPPFDATQFVVTPISITHPHFVIHEGLANEGAPQADPDGDRVTGDAFDTVNAAWTLDRVLQAVESSGYSLSTLFPKPFDVFPHGMSDLNAYFNPTDGTLVFGTGEGAWHAAGDFDVVNHEFGHLLLDRLNPGLFGPDGGEGDAFHEGFADGLTILLDDSPRVVESAGRMLGEKKAIRDHSSACDLPTTGSEPHERGCLYAGLVWDLRVAMRRAGIDEATARKTCISALLQTGIWLTVSRPTPVDFFLALHIGLTKTIEASSDTRLKAQANRLLQALGDAAARKGLRNAAVDTTASAVVSSLEAAEAIAAQGPIVDGAALATALNAQLPRQTAWQPSYTVEKTVALPDGGKKIFLRGEYQGADTTVAANKWVTAVVATDGRVEALSPDWQTKMPPITCAALPSPNMDLDDVRRLLQNEQSSLLPSESKRRWMLQRAIQMLDSGTLPPIIYEVWTLGSEPEVYGIYNLGGVQVFWSDSESIARVDIPHLR